MQVMLRIHNLTLDRMLITSKEVNGESEEVPQAQTEGL